VSVIPAGGGRPDVIILVDLTRAYLNTADQVKELHALARLAALDVPTEA
jgi:hypothetical protein